MLEVAVNIDDPWIMAFTLYAAGLACVANDDFEQAKVYAKKQFEIYEMIGDAIGMTTPLIVLGHAAMGLGELEKAHGYYRRCLDISLDNEYYYSIQTSSKYLAKVTLALNNLEETEKNLKQALKITNEIGFVRDIVYLIYEYSRLFNAKGELESATRLLSLVIHHPESDRHRMLDGRIRDNAKELMEHVKSGLSPSTFDRAESQGKYLDLDEVSRMLIAKDYELI